MEEDHWALWLDEDDFLLSRRGVLTSSAVNVSTPCHVTDCTILSSQMVAFCLTFFDFEARDIVGAWIMRRVTVNCVGPGKLMSWEHVNSHP